MSKQRSPASVLDEDHATFIQGGVSVVVATRDAELVPHVVRGCGCRVSRDRRRVTVLVEPAWVDELVRIGYRQEFSRVVRGGADRDLAAIAFTPTSAVYDSPLLPAASPVDYVAALRAARDGADERSGR